ncbi:hypothetical protein ID866_7665 [Astraeus odoratus]|nr:hypothetical protein ID866_7665 [Astraeus odoratus]
MSLHTLPYDLLFHIVQYLDVADVHCLQAAHPKTCKSLRSFALTRPVYRLLACTLLSRSRPLPLPAFQRLADLSTENLIRAVDRASQFERSWRVRAPRPATSPFPLPPPHAGQGRSFQWYTRISAPPNEEIDWLSPITSSYTLCATKTGRVVCWDVAQDVCLAEWDPRTLGAQLPSPNGVSLRAGAGAERKWELWKCRVEFDERAVYFTMARVLKGSYDDARAMEFVLMKLAFPPEPPERTSPNASPLSNPQSIPADNLWFPRQKSPETSSSSTRCSPTSTSSALPIDPCYEPDPSKPVFLHLTSFYTTGVVMNVFLLDPPRRLLSAFVWIASSSTIGLYVLLDWAEDEYVFVDTSVSCLISSNWSCILHEDQIVIHSEEADAAYQYFYPLNILRKFSRARKGGDDEASADGPGHQDPLSHLRSQLPFISKRLRPVKSISKKFVFPRVAASTPPRDTEPSVEALLALGGIGFEQNASGNDDPAPADVIAGPSSLSGPVNGNGNGRTEIVPGGSNISEMDTVATRASSDRSVKGKDKARAMDEDTIEEQLPPPAPESPCAKEKGKMKERSVSTHDQSVLDEIETGSAPAVPGPSSATEERTVPPPSTALVPVAQTPEPEQNPYPFPPWYPESAHFVRQWWPTLPGVPRLSCTVVLLAAHDPDTHRTRFVLAQHYFRVPIAADPPDASASNPDDDEDDEMLHLWYVSTPFEVVCVLDGPVDDEDDEDTEGRPRPLVAVDFGHAVWVEYAAEPGGIYDADVSRLVGDASFADHTEGVDVGGSHAGVDAFGLVDGSSTSTSLLHAGMAATATITFTLHDGDNLTFDSRRHRVPKCLRFVTFPPVHGPYSQRGKPCKTREEAIVRTLEIPDELDLDGVETINIDQSQGAVILSVKEGKIFILRYE